MSFWISVTFPSAFAARMGGNCRLRYLYKKIKAPNIIISLTACDSVDAFTSSFNLVVVYGISIEDDHACQTVRRVDHAMGNIRKKFITPDELSKDIEEELPQEPESGEGNTEELPESTFPLPSKKKERSLSSMGKSPNFSNQNVGRTKSGSAKAGSSGGKALVIEEPDENIEKRREKSRFLLAGPKVEQKNQASK